MSSPLKVLAFAGSLRKASFNRKLLAVAAQAAQEEGAEVRLIDLNSYALPIYNGDIEDAGMPENVRKLQDLMREHDALMIVSPEYNGSLTAAVKNTLDWISRPQADGSSGGALFKGKRAVILSASPGAAGGLRGLIVLRDALAKLGLWVAPSQFALGQANEAFSDNGQLKDSKTLERVKGVIREFLNG
ncbi:MAG: NAD(P)H-dependent oxidoreductase [Idiomarina sp.]|nr:NAD(P)H-dependent oxidoreductase [Idiomarina sp.]